MRSLAPLDNVELRDQGDTDFLKPAWRMTEPKRLKTDPLKRRGRTKCHTPQTLAPIEAAITQLTDTVGDRNI